MALATPTYGSTCMLAAPLAFLAACASAAVDVADVSPAPTMPVPQAPVRALAISLFLLAAPADGSIRGGDDAGQALFVGEPIWHGHAGPAGRPQYVLFRKVFLLAPEAQVITRALLQVTAQASPAIGSVDTGNQPKLLGAFKVALDGHFLAMGPGRSLYGQQSVDQIDVTHLLSGSGARRHLLAVSSFHSKQNRTSHYPWAPGAGTPRLALGLQITTADGRTRVVAATDASWSSFNADPGINPSGNSGCIWYRQYQENLNMSAMPHAWWQLSNASGGNAGGSSNAVGGGGWGAVQLQPAFESALTLKPTRPVLMSSGRVRLLHRGPGHYILDCGREIQGGIVVRLRASMAREGQAMTVGYGEEVSDSHVNPGTASHPHNNTIPNCSACTVRCCPMRTTNVFLSTWSLSSAATTIFEHEYKTFRYAELVGAPEGLTDADAESWIVRYPFGDEEATLLQTTPQSAAQPSGPRQQQLAWPGVPSGLTSLESADANLDAVFRFSQYTNVAGSLDTSTDSNTRQRSTCHIDMRVATLAQLYSLDGSTAMPTHNVGIMLQNDSDIIDGWSEFKAATVFTAHHALWHGGSTASAEEHYERLRLFTLANFLDDGRGGTGLITKPSSNLGGDEYMNGPFKCLNGTSPCAGDLVDWPRNNRDNYSCEDIATPVVSTVPNAYAAQAIGLFGEIAAWLNRTDDARAARRTAAALRSRIIATLWNESTGLFVDGLGYPHQAVHASIVAAASGIVTTPAMAEAVLSGLERRGLYDGQVVTTCWIAGATLEGLYQMAAVSEDGRAAEVALRYMTRTGQRSWLGMMAAPWNATMTMEAWSPADNTGSPGSGTGGEGITFSHPWCSSPANVIPRLLFGLTPSGRGWETSGATVRPQPGSLPSATLRMMIGYGSANPIVVALSQLVTPPSAAQQVAELKLTVTLPPQIARATVCLPPGFGADPKARTNLTVDGQDVPGDEVVVQGRFLCTNVSRIGAVGRVISRTTHHTARE
jgi:hypothetical protein